MIVTVGGGCDDDSDRWWWLWWWQWQVAVVVITILKDCQMLHLAHFCHFYSVLSLSDILPIDRSGNQPRHVQPVAITFLRRGLSSCFTTFSTCPTSCSRSILICRRHIKLIPTRLWMSVDGVLPVRCLLSPMCLMLLYRRIIGNIPPGKIPPPLFYNCNSSHNF